MSMLCNHVLVCVCVCVCVRACVCARVRVHVRVDVCMCTHVHIHACKTADRIFDKICTPTNLQFGSGSSHPLPDILKSLTLSALPWKQCSQTLNTVG